MRVAELISSRWCFAIFTVIAMSTAVAAAQQPLMIETSSPLPTGRVQTTYSQTLEASGGTPPYRWILAHGDLPPGLDFNSSGLISGTPGSPGLFEFTVRVVDGVQEPATKDFRLSITRTLSITTASPLPNGTLGTAYSQTLAATGGIPPYTWLHDEGELPPGLNLTSSGGSSGLISGTPTSLGIFSFVAMVVENNPGCPPSVSCLPVERDLKRFDITIDPPLTITTPSPLGIGVVGTPYSARLEASGGAPPYTWVRTVGSLPPGLVLTSSGPSSGLISGTPASSGNFNFTAQVTDTVGRTAVRAFDVIIHPPLTITTSSPLPVGVVAAPYSRSLTASGGTLPYTWVRTGGSLPPGLIFSSSGDSNALISGTPTSPGDFNFTAQVTDSGGRTAVKVFDVTINSALTITTASPLPVGVAGTPYSQSLTASGGTQPFTWVRSAGSLPAGLDLSSNGLISGTPTSAGNFNFTAQVTDTGGRTAVKTFDVSIIPPLTITTVSPLPNGTEGTAYSHPLAASGGSPPYSWSITGLPPGLTLNTTNGTISGAPRSSGSFGLTVRVTDSAGRTATKILDIAIDPPPLTITTPSVPTGMVGTAYSQQLAATGGTPPHTWTRSVGSLPPGLDLNSGGLISGTPTSPGSFTFTAQVTDNAQRTASQIFNITINPLPLTITTASPLPTGMMGTAYMQQQLEATGGTLPHTWARSAGSLPAGLDLSSDGLISGTPTSPGNFNFTAQVMDSARRTTSRVFDITIDPLPLTITTVSPLPTRMIGTAYRQQQLEATGGTPPYTWVMSAGSLPVGLNLDSSGLISGTPTSSGNFNFTTQVTDNAQRTAIRTFEVTIDPLTINITGPGSADSVDQPSGNITLSNSYPSPITARITLTFSPDGNLPDNREVGFLVDRRVIGRVIDIALPAGSTTGPEGFAFQAGTVAGVIRISVTRVTVEDSGTDITPSSPPSHTIVVNRRAPVIDSVTIGSRTASSFEVVITGYSNIRAVSQGTFRFTGRAGSNLQTESIPTDLNNDFSTWYANSDSLQWGGQFRSVTIFTVQGDIDALSSVSVTLTNAVGTSQARSANF
jgi:Putative Ig domain